MLIAGASGEAIGVESCGLVASSPLLKNLGPFPPMALLASSLHQMCETAKFGDAEEVASMFFPYQS